jgi:sterol 3beta-glucosyltransferase
MHITILVLGSRGDVQPYVALGRGLQDAGHRIRVVTFESFAPLVREQGLDFEPVKGDAQAILNNAAGVGLMESTGNVFTALRGVLKTYGALVDDYIDAFSSPRLRNTDAIIDQLPGCLFGFDLAEKLHVPHIIASVIPLVATRAWPLPLIQWPALGGWANRLSYTAMEQATWRVFRSAINRFRKKLDLPPSRFFGHFGTMAARRDPVIQGFSPRVVPPPADWGTRVHTTGYWLLREEDWQPSPSLTAFLESGSPPVFVGFGSMPMRDPKATTTTVLEALRQSSQRAILSSGWAGLGESDLPDHVMQIGYAPYSWLFPRMAAIVHHGGSGTTGLALRSGVPSIVVPFGADQPYWGRRVFDLGAGPEPVPFKKLTAERLADAIRKAVTDEATRQRAADLGAALHSEDGLGDAVRAITAYLNSAF